ncbi:MAG: glutathione S-transferase [Pseudomonadales bacterium]
MNGPYSVNTTPILYSFRRCPFAIRARMALIYSGIQVELREVKLSDMPDSMLRLSPKATVPVLVLGNDQVIDESLDVMLWSLSQSDPQHWLDIDEASKHLIWRNDEEFKPLLDCYKYADRHTQRSQLEHRTRAETFLSELNQLLNRRPYLSDGLCRLADVAIFPFIRQFAGVDPAWFERCEYSAVRNWLNTMLANIYFQRAMQKNRFWQPGAPIVYL